jgi:hypothetical protein
MHALMKALPYRQAFFPSPLYRRAFALALPDWYSFVVGLVQEEPDWG